MVSFNPDTDIPDLSGKVIFVTGGNIGLGKETVLQLSKHNPAHIYLGARSREKATEAISDIKNTAPGGAPITFVELDLASFESVKRAASDILSQTQELHLLVNNAGIMNLPPARTKEGYEVQFGTNHMGHALLTKLLLPVMQKTAQKHKDVRVVTLSSMAESWAPATGYDFASLKTDAANVFTVARYGTSKVANIHHSRALSRKYPEIRFVSVHPGVVNTNLSQGMKDRFPLFAPIMKLLSALFTTNVANGTKNQLWACVSPDAKSGEFYHPVGVANKGSKLSLDTEQEAALWKWTEQELKDHI
ncbi:retinol dehydrogenase [Paramyrothecium foliicola]|nr:retinol dehydrogenase [Paramyrothecium foliicola]